MLRTAPDKVEIKTSWFIRIFVLVYTNASNKNSSSVKKNNR
jgi:hypothetical protein